METCDGIGVLRICCALTVPVFAALRIFPNRFCADGGVLRYGPLTVPRTVLTGDGELRNPNICLCVVFCLEIVPGVMFPRFPGTDDIRV